jgi:hypothetical protein
VSAVLSDGPLGPNGRLNDPDDRLRFAICVGGETDRFGHAGRIYLVGHLIGQAVDESYRPRMPKVLGLFFHSLSLLIAPAHCTPKNLPQK